MPPTSGCAPSDGAAALSPPTADGWSGVAAEALRLATVRPQQAEARARRAEQGGLAGRDWSTVSVARRASGVAALQLRRHDVAVLRLRGAIEAGRKATDPRLVGEAQMSLASALVLRGAPVRAYAAIDSALRQLTGLSAARARVQRSAISQELGRVDDALDDLRLALPVLRRHRDVEWEARALSNRSLILAARRLFAAAEADLTRAHDLCAEHDLALADAYVQQNLGCVHAGRGDVPAALKHFDAAAAHYEELGLEVVGSLLVDRANLLLSVRLVAEARATAEAAVAAFAAQRRTMNVPEALLLLSTTALLDNDLETATSAAATAARAFARLGRREWLALARYAQLQAAVAATNLGSTDPRSTGTALTVSSRRARASATELERAGWILPALEARVLAGRLALQGGQPEAARSDLAVAARARRAGPADVRARAWLAEALLREADGRLRGAKSALRAGLRVVEDYQATLGATELRAHVSVHRGAIARHGLRMALSDGDARAAHWWAERGRASATRMRPVRPPDDPALAHDLEDLRATMAEIDAARSAGSATSALVARQVQLEHRIRDHSRRTPGVAGQPATVTPSIAELAAGLGETALVEYLELNQALYAVTITGGRVALHQLGSSDPVRHCLTHLPFALHRMAHPATSPIQLRAATGVLDHVAPTLDAILLAPLARWLGSDRPLVVVPTGWLQSLPWSVLPSCAGRAVSVSPSAALWHTAHLRHAAYARNRQAGGVAVVAGPGLPGALEEAHAIAALHGDAQLLQGDAATAAAVAAAMNGAGLAHVAAHGTLRSDNPLFSSLLLADGPFTVYDLERLATTPHQVVLAACDTARSHVTAGEEILGLTAALLSQHTATLVAPVVPIPDAETAPLMTRYHRNLLGGQAPASALAQAQQQHDPDSPRSRASAASFICLGAGHTAAPQTR